MNNAKKIVIVSCVFPPEPLVSARISEAIAQQLSKDENVVVLCPTPTRPVGRTWTRVQEDNTGYEVITLSSFTCPESKIFGRLIESYSFGKAVAEYIKINHEDIKAVYANTHPTFGQYLLLSAAQKHGIPCAIHIQDLYPESLTSKLGLLGKLVNPVLVKVDAQYMRKASKLIAISGDMKQCLSATRKFKTDNIEVVYNWQDEQRFLKSTPHKEKEPKFTFMFLGNINPTANIPTVINAFGKISKNDARLIIAGSGADRERCVELASQYPDSDIVFTEALPEEVPAMQAKADVLLLPLLKGISKTAMPSKLPAYMFSAKPVLACVERDSDVGRTILDSGCGWVVDPENIGELAKQMQKCIDIPRNTLQEMGEKGKEFGLANFSTNVNLNKICNLIKNLCNGGQNSDNK